MAEGDTSNPISRKEKFFSRDAGRRPQRSTKKFFKSISEEYPSSFLLKECTSGTRRSIELGRRG
jgi:hypothetical protein